MEGHKKQIENLKQCWIDLVKLAHDLTRGFTPYGGLVILLFQGNLGW